MPKSTRGFGLLENFLSARRAGVAGRFLADGPGTGRILDIGCGLYPAFLLGTGFDEKYGLDRIDRGVCRYAQDKVRMVNHDIAVDDRLPFADDYFDAVTMLAVIEHVPKKIVPRIFSEVFRVLKERGKLIITTPAGYTRPILNVMAVLGIVSATEIREHRSHFFVSEIVSFLEAARFPERSIRSGYFEFRLNTWVVAEKAF